MVSNSQGRSRRGLYQQDLYNEGKEDIVCATAKGYSPKKKTECQAKKDVLGKDGKLLRGLTCDSEAERTQTCLEALGGGTRMSFAGPVPDGWHHAKRPVQSIIKEEKMRVT